MLTTVFLTANAGHALAYPVGPSRPAMHVANPSVVLVHETDGSELVWQPLHNLERSWTLTDPTVDPNNFDQVYMRATVFGDAISELRLGLKYYKGEGVEQNLAASAKWLRLSAQQGNHTAQAILGFQYYSGAGVPRDLVEAHLWETLALSTLPDGKAHDSVASLLESIEREMTDAERLEAEQRVRDWYAGATSLR
jgi:TPR repeat protein